jgi:hypothetical protein
MSGKTHLLIVGLTLLAIVAGLYATGPTFAATDAPCTHGEVNFDGSRPHSCPVSHRAAAWERVWLAIVGD